MHWVPETGRYFPHGNAFQRHGGFGHGIGGTWPLGLVGVMDTLSGAHEGCTRRGGMLTIIARLIPTFDGAPSFRQYLS